MKCKYPIEKMKVYLSIAFYNEYSIIQYERKENCVATNFIIISKNKYINMTKQSVTKNWFYFCGCFYSYSFRGYSFCNGIITPGKLCHYDNCVICKTKLNISGKICFFIASNFCDFLHITVPLKFSELLNLRVLTY